MLGEIKFNSYREYEGFVKLVKKKMIDKDLSTKDLASLTGYSLRAVQKFLNYEGSRFVAEKIAEQLNIEKGDWQK